MKRAWRWFMGVLSISAVSAEPAPNILLICVDDLRPELRSFGASYVHSPHIDSLAQKGRAFTRHYVNAPTCGASRYTLLTGRYGPADNQALYQRALLMKKNPDQVSPSLPAWFRRHGYTTVSVGKVSHHPGGLAGEDWDDENKKEMPQSWDRHLMPCGDWQHPRGAMHGLAHGEIRVKRNEMAVFQAKEGGDEIYPDGLIVEEALKQLDQLSSNSAQKPFFLAVGMIRPHLPFGAPKKYLDLYREVELPPIPHPEKPTGVSTWHRSGEFMAYQRWGKDPRKDAAFADKVRRHYAACVSYADAQVGKILVKLESSPASQNTLIILWGDHGWHLGEHAIWGKHSLYEESLRSPLIIVAPKVSLPGVPTDAMVETLDLFPTLCELTQLPVPDFVQGTSLVPQLSNPKNPGHPVVGYHRKRRTVRTETHRLVIHQQGKGELYDHRNDPGETKNIFETNEIIVNELKFILTQKTRK